MEPGQPREVREPGPGAETAVAPRWEEAKTFYDNLSPKKKPKSVKSGVWVWGGGDDTGRATYREGSQALWKWTRGTPPGGDTAPPPQNVPGSWLGLQFILGALLWWRWFIFPIPGSGSTPESPSPMLSSGAYPLPGRWQPLKRSRTALVDRAGQQPGQQRPGLVGSGSPAARCVLRSPASVRPARLPSSSLGS